MKVWHEKVYMDPEVPVRVEEATIGYFNFHWHNEFEILLIIEDVFNINVNDKEYVLNKDDIMLINSCELHSINTVTGRGRCILIQFNPVILGEHAGLLLSKNVLSPAVKTGDKVYNLLHGIIMQIFEEWHENKTGRSLFIKMKIEEFVIGVIRNLPLSSISQKNKDKINKNLHVMNRIIAYIENNYDKEITLDEISKNIGFSSCYFSRFFKKNTGMAFASYVSSYRVERAAGLLLKSDDTITDIAYKAGFNSIKTFYRCFKEIKGYSPLEYKKMFYDKI